MSHELNVNTFFALLRAGLFGRTETAEITENVDWEEVFHLAEEQCVVGLIAAGIESLNVELPLDVKLQIVGETLQIEQKNKEMNTFVAKLSETLHRVGVEFVLLKGQGVAQCYERPLWRSSGDVDLLLDDANFNKAQEYLYTIASKYEPLLKEEKHQEFTVGTWIVELHGNQPIHFSKRTDTLLASLQDDAFNKDDVREWDNGGVAVKLLNSDIDVIFVFTHYLKHFFRGGIGLRQICDWCRLLWTYKDELNQELLETRINEAGLMSEWKAFGALAVEWLGMPCEAVPFYSIEKKWKRKAKRIVEFVLMTGNFGHNRDSSYYKKYPYIIGKFISLYWRSMDNIRYFFIFPTDSFRVFAWLMKHGFKSM